MKKVVRVVAGSLWALPFLASAQSVNYLTDLLNGIKSLLDQLVVVLVALAVVWFIWNVIQYTIAEDEDKKKKAKSQMIWGIVAIAVIVSIWGLVGILQNIFGVTNNQSQQVRQLVPW